MDRRNASSLGRSWFLGLVLAACTSSHPAPYVEPSPDDVDDGKADEAPADDEAVHETDEPACGDGVVDIGEQCDDGGTAGGDGCSEVCLNENADPDGGICGDGTCDAAEGPERCAADCECEPGTVEILCNAIESACFFRDHPRFEGDCADCVDDGSGRFPDCSGAGDCWRFCADGHWTTEPWCESQCEDRTGGVPDACACPDAGNAENFCHLAPRTSGCPMTAAGGYCDPDGDGQYDDGDWDRGASDYDSVCRGQRRVVPEDPADDECQACGDLTVASDETPCDCPEAWRVVYDESFDSEVSQVCRQGVWLNFNLDPRDPGDCCGGDFQGCCRERDTRIGCY